MVEFLCLRLLYQLHLSKINALQSYSFQLAHFSRLNLENRSEAYTGSEFYQELTDALFLSENK